jgi:hypothetical protein
VCFKQFSSKQNLDEHRYLHEQEIEDSETYPTVDTRPIPIEISIPRLSDMIEMSDDFDLKPLVTVVHMYPYAINFQGDQDQSSSDDESSYEEA